MIGEFSTGIIPDRTSEGGWVSHRFAGEYMNKVGGDGPQIIHKAISNRLFAAVEGSTDRPAFIMRMLYDEKGKPPVAVIVFLSRFSDARGRPCTGYRYFYAMPGQGGMKALIKHVEEYQRETGHLPVLDPFETPGVPRKHYLTPEDSTPLKGLTKGVTYGGSLGVRDAWNSLLKQKKQDSSTPLAVAVGCTALVKPQTFGRIHTPNKAAAESIARQRVAQEKVSPKTDQMASQLNSPACNAAITRLILHTEEASIPRHVQYFQQMKAIAQKPGGQAVIENIFEEGGHLHHPVSSYRLKARVIFYMLTEDEKTYKQMKGEITKNNSSNTEAALKVLDVMAKMVKASSDIYNIRDDLDREKNVMVEAFKALKNIFQIQR